MDVAIVVLLEAVTGNDVVERTEELATLEITELVVKIAIVIDATVWLVAAPFTCTV